MWTRFFPPSDFQDFVHIIALSKQKYFNYLMEPSKAKMHNI